MTASRLLTIAVQLQSLSAERSLTSWRAWRGSWWGAQPVFWAQAIYWWLESWIRRHAAKNDHMDFVAFTPASDFTSSCKDQWLVCSQEGEGSNLISWLIHIPSEQGRMEVCMWRIITNTQAVSLLYRSSRTLHNYTASADNHTWASEQQPYCPWSN